MIIDQCPYCATRHVQMNQEMVCRWGATDVVEVGRCQNPACEKQLIVLRDFSGKKGTPRLVYPIGKYPLDDKLQLPDRVREEFAEAAGGLDVDFLLSSMTMSRRVLQRCLKQHGFGQRTLADQIDAAKKDGTIPKRYHDLADEVRTYGNIGAHPDDDNLELVTRDNATHLLEFVKILIEEFYVLPAKAAALQKGRTERRGS